ncbi:MAG: hypothetical protein Q9Q40_04110 [Acidobacteriota bacterium]|nr:hypothetical protein [Acidobacteriota bacterium]MDQ7088203.1 hypothetical protein [Acidobacteriota bacterium]
MADDAQASLPLIVICPCCRGRLTVDPGSGEVLDAEQASKTPRDFDDALGAVQEAGSRRDEDFLRAFRSEQKRGQTLERKFRLAKEKARKDPTPPKNPLDFE